MTGLNSGFTELSSTGGKEIRLITGDQLSYSFHPERSAPQALPTVALGVPQPPVINRVLTFLTLGTLEIRCFIGNGKFGGFVLNLKLSNHAS